MPADLAAYYDRLTRWNGLARAVGYGGGRDTLTVHRPLADPRADGRATTTRLHDLLFEVLSGITAPRVLDAGCGLGGTMIDFATRLGGHYVGLTLSDAQASIARTAVREAGLSERVVVHVQSYDDPPEGPFDVVLALESLAHSDDPSASVSALARVVAPGGVLAIVDDMPEEGAQGSADLAAFKLGWRCPVLWGQPQYLWAFTQLGLRVLVDRDLSDEERPRSAKQIDRLLTLNNLAARLVPFSGVREVLASHRGGLALERLSRKGLVRYRLLVTESPR